MRVPAARADELHAAFLAFHAANPHVYTRLVEMTTQARARGARRVGIASLFEVLRWEHFMATDRPAGEFKLNNSHRAFYVREIQSRRPDLGAMFETRRSAAGRVSAHPLGAPLDADGNPTLDVGAA